MCSHQTRALGSIHPNEFRAKIRPTPYHGSASGPRWVIHTPRSPAGWGHRLYNTFRAPGPLQRV